MTQLHWLISWTGGHEVVWKPFSGTVSLAFHYSIPVRPWNYNVESSGLINNSCKETIDPWPLMVLPNSILCVSSCATNTYRVTKRSNSGDPEKSNHLRHVHNALSVLFQVLYVQTNEIKVPEGLAVAAATPFLLPLFTTSLAVQSTLPLHWTHWGATTIPLCTQQTPN